MTSIAVLDSADIAALRAAYSVTFHTNMGRAFIRAYKRTAPGCDVFTAREQRLFPVADDSERFREITVDHTAYGYEPGWRGATDYLVAFHMIHTAEYRETWRTVVELIRAGDRVRLDWVADNNSTTLVEHELHADELRLHIARGERKMIFHIATSVTPDNSARMIRRHG